MWLGRNQGNANSHLTSLVPSYLYGYLPLTELMDKPEDKELADAVQKVPSRGIEGVEG
jgi:hypothetical protein